MFVYDLNIYVILKEWYSMVPNKHYILVPYRFCLLILDKSAGWYDYYENIITITLLLLNKIQIYSFCYVLYMHQELHFIYNFILVLWYFFQFLKGGIVTSFCKFWWVVLVLGGYYYYAPRSTSYLQLSYIDVFMF